MVTAGVYLLIRFSLLFEYCPLTLKIILFLGCLTAFMSALIGSFQYDVKKIIAYSTCSQLGYMVVSCGLSNYVLSLFHLVNHAFFKALLFLSSGLLIAFIGEQDIRKYNIFLNKPSILALFFLVPNLSLCGFPFFAGAFSKELIIQYSKLNFLIDGSFVFNILLLSAGLTTFYSFKLLYIIFIKNPTIKIYYHKPHNDFYNEDFFDFFTYKLKGINEEDPRSIIATFSISNIMNSTVSKMYIQHYKNTKLTDSGILKPCSILKVLMTQLSHS
jgi:NADH:ubiquinone oxidoreductase subunit 5 (subunit L)/multisubunit Na+/H+ antiporter MnhA subunit